MTSTREGKRVVPLFRFQSFARDMAKGIDQRESAAAEERRKDDELEAERRE